jgi:hypothetical protein
VPTEVTEKLNCEIEIAIPGGIADAESATTPTVEEAVVDACARSAALCAREIPPVEEIPVPEESVTVPVIAPVLAGVTVMFNVHDAPLAKDPPQLSVSLYSPLGVITKLVSVWPVLFVSVATCDVDCASTVWTPKLITGGVRINP